MNKITISNSESIFKKHPEAYTPVDLTEAYMLLCMHAVPDPSLYKSIDTAIRKSADALLDQLMEDGLEHVRVRIGDSTGKATEVLCGELPRVMAFYAVVIRTKEGYHTEDILEAFGFTYREQLIHDVPELYSDEKEPKLLFKKFTPIRTLVKKIVAENEKLLK